MGGQLLPGRDHAWSLPLFLSPAATLAVAALAGEAGALRQLATATDSWAGLSVHRIGPALAARAAELGITGQTVATWQQALRQAAAHRLRLELAMSRLGQVLDQAAVPWAPIKGMGRVALLYPTSDERPTSDLDILIFAEDLDRARQALVRAGWQAHSSGSRAEHYLRCEGYAWVATDLHGLALELHFRLWGTVPEGLGKQVLTRAVAEPDLGRYARLLRLADTYLLAAVHLWLTPGPRPLLYWWELHRIVTATTAAERQEIVRVAMEAEQPLLVGAAAAVACQLWPDTGQSWIAEQLLAGLRAPERLALTVLRWRGPSRLSYGTLFVAGRLAGRAARGGWRSAWRRLWVHPWLVELQTPADWPWVRRRLWHLASTLHLGPLQRWLEGPAKQR